MLSKTMISKGKPATGHSDDSVLKVGVSRIRMADYEVHHYFKEKIKEVALSFGEIQTTTCMDLDQVIFSKVIKKCYRVIQSKLKILTGYFKQSRNQGKINL